MPSKNSGDRVGVPQAETLVGSDGAVVTSVVISKECKKMQTSQNGLKSAGMWGGEVAADLNDEAVTQITDSLAREPWNLVFSEKQKASLTALHRDLPANMLWRGTVVDGSCGEFIYLDPDTDALNSVDLEWTGAEWAFVSGPEPTGHFPLGKAVSHWRGPEKLAVFSGMRLDHDDILAVKAYAATLVGA